MVRIDRQTLVSNMLRVGGIGLVAALLFGMLAGPASADPVYGGMYENATYGFTFEFEEAIWTVDEFEAAGADGVNLQTVNSFGMIWGIPVDDASTCYDDMIASLEVESGLDFDVAPERFERPEPGADLRGELALAEFTDETGTYGMLVYGACLPLDGGASVLNVMLAVDAAVYDLELEHWQNLLGSLDVDGEPNGDDGVAIDFDLGVVEEESGQSESADRPENNGHAERNGRITLDQFKDTL